MWSYAFFIPFCFYKQNFQDEEDEVLNEGSMRYVCYGSGCAWKGGVVNEELWFLSTASEKVADPRGVVAKGAV